MAENTEIDAINHLLEVEKNASALINDAAQEADRRLSEQSYQLSDKCLCPYPRCACNNRRNHIILLL